MGAVVVSGQAFPPRYKLLRGAGVLAAFAATLPFNPIAGPFAAAIVYIGGTWLLDPRQLVIDGDEVHITTNLLPSKRTLVSNHIAALSLVRRGKRCRAEVSGITVWFGAHDWQDVVAAAGGTR